MSFPNKEVRQKCYQSRDAYWECLDKQEANNNSSQCNEFRNQFEKLCPSQWVRQSKPFDLMIILANCYRSLGPTFR